jgi:hypothetical protein
MECVAAMFDIDRLITLCGIINPAGAFLDVKLSFDFGCLSMQRVIDAEDQGEEKDAEFHKLFPANVEVWQPATGSATPQQE